MAPVTFSGSLQTKKKAELLEIAQALRISDAGTKEDLQIRIKKHLDKNQADLEDAPAFAGLFGKKKSQPAFRRFMPPVEPKVSPVEESASTKTSGSSPRNTRSNHHTALLDPLGSVRQSTPISDMRDVSMMLKNPPFSPPADEEPSVIVENRSIREKELPRSPAKYIIPSPTKLQRTANAAVVKSSEVVTRQTVESLLDVRTFLSSSCNIWSLTAVLELLYIIYTLTPWKYAEIPLSPTQNTGFSVPYPPLAAFHSPTMWAAILNWSIPTLFIPALFGTVISFHPANMTSARAGRPTSPPLVPFDPLTASIIRLAAQFVYPFGLADTDVIGQSWRVVTAAVTVAFALVEAIFGAPGAFAKASTGVTTNSGSSPPLTNGKRVLVEEDTVIAVDAS
ncbi:hypothetical protein BJ138DRAFT_1149773 [Hygrophoropsis aurantiaca]|uniref:Uncharacterized protein n=1 Tax=Hygrophoropsis aurantiaca TaxID=72124 RepID=A0ACB8AF26_9AGAM|nr:hypothetical protein BJ138DRAFT_1149773 [Hygrophoropsis aurantiaca]